jgi:DNA topoisomerase IA
LLPLLCNGSTAQLHDPKIEDKETRPPPRYNEGTLIEAISLYTPNGQGKKIITYPRAEVRYLPQSVIWLDNR